MQQLWSEVYAEIEVSQGPSQLIKNLKDERRGYLETVDELISREMTGKERGLCTFGVA
jgi:hypothetical protein